MQGNARKGNGCGAWPGALLAACLALTLSACSKDAVDEQKTNAAKTGPMNAQTQPYPAANPAYPYPVQPVPGGQAPLPRGGYAPYGQGYGQYGQYGWPQQRGYSANPGYSSGTGAPAPGYGSGYGQSPAWNGPRGGTMGGYPGQAPGYAPPQAMASAPDWAHQGQVQNPWAGAGQQWPAAGSAPWTVQPPAPRYRPLDEDEKARAAQGSNPWVAPYDKPIGSSHSEQPSPPVVPGLAAPGVVAPYGGYGLYSPGIYGLGLPVIGTYPGMPGVLGPWMW